MKLADPSIRVSRPPCSICRTAIAEMRSDMGPVCRDCKAHLISAENVLSQMGIPPQPPKTSTNS